MSHAVYSFLLSLDESEQDGKVLCSAAMEAYDSYGEEHTDDNNWGAPVVLVMKDGRNLADFGKDEVSDRYAASDEKFTWDSAIRYALGCVVLDMEVFDLPVYDFGKDDPRTARIRMQVEAMSAEELYHTVLERYPKKIIAAYEEFLLELRTGKYPDPYKKLEEYRNLPMHHWQRNRAVEHFEKFIRARLPPFSTEIATPYAYRCYDLTDGDEPTAILQMDIHT